MTHDETVRDLRRRAAAGDEDARVELDRVVEARVTRMPRPMPEGAFDPMPKVVVTTFEGREVELFEYYPDELSFEPGEFVGLTLDQARRLKFEKDRRYLRGDDGPLGNPSDETARDLERRAAAGDEDAALELVEALRDEGDPSWVGRWLSTRVRWEGQLPLDDVRSIVGAVAKGQMPWAWLYASPVKEARDPEREEDEELERLVEMALKKVPDEEFRKPTGAHDRWLFVLAVRRGDGSVVLGAKESRVGTVNRTYGDALDVSHFNLGFLWPKLAVKERWKAHIAAEEAFVWHTATSQFDAGRPYLTSGAANVHAYEGGAEQDVDGRTGARLPHDRPGSTLSRFLDWAGDTAPDRVALSREEALQFAGKLPRRHPKGRRNPDDAGDGTGLTKLCAWCGKHMSGPLPRPGVRNSHGICAACLAQQLRESGLPADDLEHGGVVRNPRAPNKRRRRRRGLQ